MTRTEVAAMDSDQAACRAAEDPELFFPSVTGAHTDIERALVFCRSCPIAAACVQRALTDDHRFGIWGGTTAHYRRVHYHQEQPR